LSVAAADVSCGMYHNALITADGQVFTWGSNKYGCLGRPSEMDVVPASYTPVPGLVESLHEVGKLGPVCSVACGRFYTAVALEPYTGPSLQALEAKARVKEEKRAALQRATEERERLTALEYAKRLARERRDLLAFLNGGYPGCKACASAVGCCGFVGDVLRPMACVVCGHMRDQHSMVRDFDDEDVTNEMLEDFKSQVLFHLKRVRPDTPE
jgi:hypothetical protein